MIFSAFSALLTRLVAEHLKDGKYDVTDVLVRETKSVPCFSHVQSKASQLHALKAQLHFRHKVLEQSPADKSIFHLSKNRVKLSIEEVCSNLFKLFFATVN